MNFESIIRKFIGKNNVNHMLEGGISILPEARQKKQKQLC